MLRTLLAAAAVLLATAACGGAAGQAGGPERSRDAEPTSSKSPRPRLTAPMSENGSLVPTEIESILESQQESAAPEPPDGRVFGADMSWPQCPTGMGIPQKRTEGRPMPTAAAEFVIIGLTNGPSFVANPCLADQVAWARERDLMVAAYSILTYPNRQTLRELGDEGPYDGSARLGALRNAGYQAALFNLRSMQEAGLRSPIVWVDVEPVAYFEWSADRVANAAVVEGTVRGYADSGLRVGFYSTPYLWETVVGSARFGGPEWRAAGQTSMAEALRRCRKDWSFQGGKGVFGQWVEAGRDRNVTCPGAVRDLRDWFHWY